MGGVSGQYPVPGDHVLMFETGYFAGLWRDVALKLGLEVDFVPGDWRHGVDPEVVAESWPQTGNAR